MEVAAVAARLVPSLPPFNHRVHREGEAFLEVGEGPGLNLLSMEGFHWDWWHKACTQAGWTALGSTDRHQSPGWAAHEPQGTKQRAQPQP